MAVGETPRRGGLTIRCSCPGPRCRFLRSSWLLGAGRRLDGVVLKTESWSVAPLAIERAHSSYFADGETFPPGSIRFDCALVMRNIPHEWETAAEMYV
jgi:hypothetical protein